MREKNLYNGGKKEIDRVLRLVAVKLGVDIRLKIEIKIIKKEGRKLWK